MDARKTKPKKPTRKPKAKPEQRHAVRLERLDLDAYQHAMVTAAAWVAAIRVKVRELSREAGVLDNILGHPEKAGESVVLRCALNPAALGRFITAAYELEEGLDDLLSGDAEPWVPNLADACRTAAEANAALYANKAAEPTEVA